MGSTWFPARVALPSDPAEKLTKASYYICRELMSRTLISGPEVHSYTNDCLSLQK